MIGGISPTMDMIDYSIMGSLDLTQLAGQLASQEWIERQNGRKSAQLLIT